MSLQILGGKLKGVKLKAPAENITRPTSVMLRRKIFDANQNLKGLVFVDLFAGSGAVGVEAFSRGCEKVIFIEKNQKALSVLKNNVKENLHNKSNFEILKMDAFSWLSKFKLENNLPTVIFFDPPYELHEYYIRLLDFFKQNNNLCDLTFWIESDCQKGLPSSFWTQEDLPVKKIYNQGQNYICVIEF